jgi:hypothetical protein
MSQLNERRGQAVDTPGCTPPCTAASTPEPTLANIATPPQRDASATPPGAQAPLAQPMGVESSATNLARFASMVIRDKETGREYMIADTGDGQQLSRQKLIDLSTNEALVLEYDTLDPDQQGSHARSARSSQLDPSAPRSTAERDPEDAGSEGGQRIQPSGKSKSWGASKAIKSWGRAWCEPKPARWRSRAMEPHCTRSC